MAEVAGLLMKRARTVALAAILLAVACNENAGTPKPAASAAPPIPAASTAPVADLPELKADPRETVLAKSVAAWNGAPPASAKAIAAASLLGWLVVTRFAAFSNHTRQQICRCSGRISRQWN